MRGLPRGRAGPSELRAALGGAALGRGRGVVAADAPARSRASRAVRPRAAPASTEVEIVVVFRRISDTRRISTRHLPSRVDCRPLKGGAAIHRFAAAGVAVLATVVLAAPAAAQGPPTVSTGPVAVNGDYVSLSGTITSPENCVVPVGQFGGCPAYYIISPAAFPKAGPPVGSLYWNNQAATQSLPLIFNMRALQRQVPFLRGQTKFTAILVADYAGPSFVYGNEQTFTWPQGTLSLSGVKLLAAGVPRIAYRLRAGKTAFESATVTITLRTPGGKRLGSFRHAAEPGQNLARLPQRLARKLTAGLHYRITLKGRDDLGRTVHRSVLARLPT